LSASKPDDAKGIAEQPQSSPSPPRLVFEPDVRQRVRVARVRTFTLLAAAILMVVALMLIITYRPPPVKLTDDTPRARSAPLAESVGSVTSSAAVQPAVAPRRAGGVEIARSAVVTVDTLVAAAGEKWLRATELLPPGVLTADNSADAAAQVRKAVILADSARRDVVQAGQQGEVVLRVSRQAGSRTAFRLGVLYTTLDRYLKAVRDDAEDRYSFYAKSEASVKAALLGDEADSETQQNVANSYLRTSENRQAGIKRLAEQVREALRNLDNVSR